MPLALQALLQVKRKFPRHVELHALLGYLFDKTGQPQKSIEALKYTLHWMPTMFWALNHLAYLYAEQGIHLEEALKLAHKALHLSPNDGDIQDTLGVDFLQTKTLQKGHFNARDGLSQQITPCYCRTSW